MGEGRIQSITKQTDKLGGDEFSNLNEVAFELLWVELSQVTLGFANKSVQVDTGDIMFLLFKTF